MITFTVGKISDLPNTIHKNFKELYSFSILLKEDTDLKNPTVIVNESNPALLFESNYASLKIGNSTRYYFIRSIRILENGNYEITMHTDVLYTYADFIKHHLSMLADRADVDSMNKLIAGDFPTNVNEKLMQLVLNKKIFSDNEILAVLAVSGGNKDETEPIGGKLETGIYPDETI